MNNTICSIPVNTFNFIFKDINQLMSFIPTADNCTGMAGDRTDETRAFLVYSHTDHRPVRQGGYWGDASNHVPDIRDEGETIGQAIVREGDGCKGVILVREYSCSYDNSEEIFERIYIPLKKLDIPKIRRRIEDRLRKDESFVLEVAGRHNIQLSWESEKPRSFGVHWVMTKDGGRPDLPYPQVYLGTAGMDHTPEIIHPIIEGDVWTHPHSGKELARNKVGEIWNSSFSTEELISMGVTHTGRELP